MENKKFLIRNAKQEDLMFAIKFVTANKWRPFGPGDYQCAYEYDPEGFYVGEINREVVSNVMMISYPGHSAHIGSLMTDKDHRGNGYARMIMKHCLMNRRDQESTIGVDSVSHMVPFFESFGFTTECESVIALLNFEAIISKFRPINHVGTSSITIKQINEVKLDTLVEYDASVFGFNRKVMVENWIKIPGSIGWVAVEQQNGGEETIVGYTLVRSIIMNYGSHIGINMAPLYADTTSIATALMRTAAETCHANQAIGATEFLLIYSKGTVHGENATKLFDEVEASYLPFATKMYTKGPPVHGQLNKMYGVMHPFLD